MNKQFLRVFLVTCLFLQMAFLMSSQVFAKHPDDEYKENIVELQSNIDETMDTSKWITHPVGRYLIKLPPTAQIQWGTLRYNDDPFITWEKDVTIQEANSLLKNKYLDLVKDEELHVEYKENFGPEGLGSLLASSYKKDPDTRGPASILYEMYVVNNKPVFDPDFEQRVYSFQYDTAVGFESSLGPSPKENIAGEFESSFTPEEILNLQKKDTDFIHILANNIWPSDMSLPLEIRNGVYFEGGFVHTPSDFHRLFEDIFEVSNEETRIVCAFSEYPHIKLSLSSTFSFYGRSVTEIETEAENESYATIVGEDPKDKLYTFTQNDVKNYIFSSSTPSMYIGMWNKGVIIDSSEEERFVKRAPLLDKPSFESDKAAIAFWNAIKQNIRWRPDNWKVRAPDTPYFIVNGKIVPAVIPE